MSRSSYGSVYQRTRRDGTPYDTWCARFVEAGKRVERTGFATKEAAWTYIAARRLERAESRALGLPEIRRVTVSELIDEYVAWLATHRRPGTGSSNSARLERLRERFGTRTMVSLRREDMIKHLDTEIRTRRYLTSTATTVLSQLSGFCRFAIDVRAARENPCKGLNARLGRPDVAEPPYLSRAELRLVYAAVPALVRVPTILCGEAGLRRDEAVYLRHDEISRGARQVVISAERSKGHRARTIPLTAVAREALAAHVKTLAKPIDGDGRVFDFSREVFGEWFRKAMKRIGRPEVTPRTLRHAFGSRAAESGMDLEILRRLMGHRSIETTMIYACHRPGNAADLAIRALDAHDSDSADAASR